MGLETSEPLEAQTVALDGVFAQKSLSFAQKAIGELEQFGVFFDNLQKNPAIQATLKSEVSRLNDMKNCEYHRAKTKQLLSDYHGCVEENLRLKESNIRLTQARKSAEAKLEVMSRKLQQMIDNNQMQSNKASLSRATFGMDLSTQARGNSKLLGGLPSVSDTRGAAANQSDPEKEKLEMQQNMARFQADNLCQKLTEMAPKSMDELEIRDNICREIESLCSVERTVILRQAGMDIYIGKKQQEMVYVPVKESSIFTQMVEMKKVHIINDAGKDR